MPGYTDEFPEIEHHEDLLSGIRTAHHQASLNRHVLTFICIVIVALSLFILNYHFYLYLYFLDLFHWDCRVQHRPTQSALKQTSRNTLIFLTTTSCLWEISSKMNWINNELYKFVLILELSYLRLNEILIKSDSSRLPVFNFKQHAMSSFHLLSSNRVL